MAELDGNERKKLYSKLYNDPDTKAETAKYSFKEWEKSFLDDAGKRSKIGLLAVGKNWVSDYSEFRNKYAPELNPPAEPPAAPVSKPAAPVAAPVAGKEKSIETGGKNYSFVGQPQTGEMDAMVVDGKSIGVPQGMTMVSEGEEIPEVEYEGKMLPEVTAYGKALPRRGTQEFELVANSNPPIGSPEYDFKIAVLNQPPSVELGAGGYTQDMAASLPETKEKAKQSSLSPVFKDYEVAQKMMKGEVPLVTQEDVRKAQEGFGRATKEQQQAAIMGGPGAELSQKYADEKRTATEKLADFGYAIGATFDNMYDKVLAAEALIGAKQKKLFTFGDLNKKAVEEEKILKQKIVGYLNDVDKKYARRMYEANIQGNVYDAIKKGQIDKLPEAIGFNIAQIGMQALAAAKTGGYSMFAQMMPEMYKAGVEEVARKTNKSVDDVIRNGEDSEVVAYIAALGSGYVEKVSAGILGQAMKSQGAYKFIRDMALKKLGKSNLARAVATGTALTGVGTIEGGVEAGQKLIEVAQRQAAAASTPQEAIQNTINELRKKGVREEVVAEFVNAFFGAGGLAGGGQIAQSSFKAFQKGPNITEFSPEVQGNEIIQEAARGYQDNIAKAEEQGRKPDAFNKRELNKLATDPEAWVKGEIKYLTQTIQDNKKNNIDSKVEETKLSRANALLAQIKAEKKGMEQAALAPAQEAATVAPAAPVAPAETITAPEVTAPVAFPSDEQIADDIRNKRYGTFTYSNESEVPEQFRDRISSRGKTNGVPFVRVTLPQSVADYEIARTTPQVTPEGTETAPVTEEAAVAEEAIPVAPETEEDYSFLEETELTPEEEAALLAQEEAAPVEPAVPVSPEAAPVASEIEKQNTFTIDDLKTISDGTGLQLKGNEALEPDIVAQKMRVGDEVTFFAERERKGVWDGKMIIEVGTNNPWGIVGILSDPNGFIRNDTKIKEQTAPAEEAAPVAPAAPAPKKEKKAPAPKAETKEEAPKPEPKKEKAPAVPEIGAEVQQEPRAAQKIGSLSYTKNKKSEGDKDTRTLGDGTKIKGTYKIVSADDVLASHNEQTFSQTPGFPTTPDGKTANDRDYKTDAQAQAQVQAIASTLDERAIDQTPVVTADGIVLDGNNRTMSRKLAAKLGTDSEYAEGLKRKLKRYGLPENALDGIPNPMLVFELETPLPYTTETFSLFNKQEKKEKGPIERAVEISKRASDRFKNILAQIYEEAETPSEVSSDPKKITKIKALLQEEGILGSNEFPRYFNEDNTATKEGVSFLETLVLGAALNENTIRTLDNPGMGNVKNIVLKSIIPLIRNSALGKDSLIPDIIEGIEYLSKAKFAKMSPVEMVSQTTLGFAGVKPPSPEALMIAITLEGGFKDFLKNYNNSVGTTDIFRGEQTKKVIIEDNLKAKIKNYEQVRQNLRLDDTRTEGEVQEGDRRRKSAKETEPSTEPKTVTTPAPVSEKEEGKKPAPKEEVAAKEEGTQETLKTPFELFRKGIEDAGFKYLSYSEFKANKNAQNWEKEGGIFVDNKYYNTIVIGDTKVAIAPTGLYFDEGRVYEDNFPDVDENGNNIFTIHQIVTTEEKRGTGSASKALSEITKAADKAGLTLQLEPVAIKPYIKKGGKSLTSSQLADWYKRNGFEQKEEGTDAILIRNPKPSKTAPSTTTSLASQVEDMRSLPPAKRKAAQQALEERYGKEDVEKMIEITANFTKIIDDLEKRGVVKIDCP